MFNRSDKRVFSASDKFARPLNVAADLLEEIDLTTVVVPRQKFTFKYVVSLELAL